MASQSVRGRALLAVGMLLGYYLLALAIVAAIIALNVAVIASGYIAFWLMGGSALVVITVLASMLFTRTRVKGVPGGFLLPPGAHQSLIELIHDVADAMGTKHPDEVYLTADVNAFVMEDTWLLGLISRKRKMAIGLGLLSAMRVDELKAVVAHEFGHYVGADTRLSAIVYRGQQTMIATLRNVGNRAVQAVIGAYFELYMRVSAGVRRVQEVEADEWSVRLAGRDHTASALRSVERAAGAFGRYLDLWVVPLLHRNLCPPDIFDGYRRYLVGAPGYTAFPGTEPTPYDSHPPMSERIATIEAMLPSGARDDPRPARSLLDRPSEVEAAVTQAVARATSFEVIETTPWDDLAQSFGIDVTRNSVTVLRLAGPLVGAGEPLTPGEFAAVFINGRAEEVRAVIADSPLAYVDEAGDRLLAAVLSVFCTMLAANDRYRWAMTWTGPPTVALDGEALDLTAHATALIAGGPDAELAAADLRVLAAV